jgi:hypothetical protein
MPFQVLDNSITREEGASPFAVMSGREHLRIAAIPRADHPCCR